MSDKPRVEFKITREQFANQGECRSCGAAIVWAKSAKGKNMPLDAASKVWRDGAYWLVSHFATCPEADSFRKPRVADVAREVVQEEEPGDE